MKRLWKDSKKTNHNFRRVRVFAASCLSSDCNNSDSTRRNFMKFNIGIFLSNLLRKIKFLWIIANDLGVYKVRAGIYHNFASVPLKVRNVSNKKSINTFCVYFFFKKSCHTWKNVKHTAERETSHRSNYIRNTAHALCLLHNKDYKRKIRIFKTIFLTATTVRRTNLNITFVSTLSTLDRNLNQIPITSCSR
jgi:hypothetical protein